MCNKRYSYLFIYNIFSLPFSWKGPKQFISLKDIKAKNSEYANIKKDQANTTLEKIENETRTNTLKTVRRNNPFKNPTQAAGHSEKVCLKQKVFDCWWKDSNHGPSLASCRREFPSLRATTASVYTPNTPVNVAGSLYIDGPLILNSNEQRGWIPFFNSPKRKGNLHLGHS